MILVLNPGSSSTKFAVYSNKKEILSGTLEHSGPYSCVLCQGSEKCLTKEEALDPLKMIFSTLKKQKIIVSQKDFAAIGIRVVHGGPTFKKTTRITPEVLKNLKKISSLAPLHNPPAIKIIEKLLRRVPHTPIYASFDTAFHSSIPEYIANYALPKAFENNFGIRKYGFHGLSCQSILKQLTILYKKKLPGRIIICHLGSGSSITAIKNGKSLDTSMGLTPLEGIIMRTRGGDMDPGVVIELLKHQEENLTLHEAIEKVENILNYESGLKGLTGGISDMRIIIEQANAGNDLCQNAIKSYVYHIQKYIGGYTAALGGCDAIVFTAGTGEASFYLREKIISGLEALGIVIDTKKNNANIAPSNIKKEDSTADIWVLHTDEAQEIMHEINALDKK
ncbi:MAG: acetate/propionate family kinase [Candidatus Gracilibacteria bacterium]